MSLQRTIDVVGASPIKSSAAFGRLADDDSYLERARVREQAYAFAPTIVSVLRFIAAAYSTGDAECWEAAFRFAEDKIGAESGPLLVARVATLVRLIRKHRELVCLPPSCNGLLDDERHILSAIHAADQRDAFWLAGEASKLGDVDPDGLGKSATAILLAISEASLRDASADSGAAWITSGR